jgi:hypothetical protein
VLSCTGSFRVQKSSGSADCFVLKVNANVRKLLSTIEAQLVSPARNREWTAPVAMPAAKEPLERFVLEVSQLVALAISLRFRAPSCICTLALWVKENSSAVEKVLRNYRFTYCWEQSPWQPCFDHAAPSEWSMRASPTVPQPDSGPKGLRPHPFPFVPASPASSILCSPLNRSLKCSAARYQRALLALASIASPTVSPRSSQTPASCTQPDTGHRLAG